MAKWTDYPTKTTPADTDDLMIYDATGKANKRVLFSGLWNWIVDKLTNAVINNLQTNNKTILGALNELNSNRMTVLRVGADSEISIPMPGYSAAIALGTTNAHVIGFYLISRGTRDVTITPLTEESQSDDFAVSVVDDGVSIRTKSSTDMRIIY